MPRMHARLVAAAVSAFAIASLCASSPAFADPGDPYKVDGTSQEAANKALINANAKTALEIHKYLGADSGTAGDGTEQTITGHDALQGVAFDVYQVGGVDLTTNVGWTAATALSGHTVTAAEIAAGKITVGATDYTLTKASSVTTDSAGTASFQGHVALYLVAENLDASSSIVDVVTGKAVDKSAVTASAPFLVTLPMTNPKDTSRWMYDVNVYPKNQADSATKAVADKGTVTTDGSNVGDHQVEFTITSSITDGSTPLDDYAVYDDLHAALTLTGVTVALSDGTTLAAGTDYEVYTDATGYRTPASTAGAAYSDGSKVAGGAVVSVVFTSTGRAKLEADRTLSVVTKIAVELGAGDTDGVIENTATFIPNGAWFSQHPGTPGNPPGVPTNEVDSKYGKVIVNKQDPTDTSADMAGAVFSIFTDPTPGDDSCTASDVSGTPINTATIAAGNALTFTGLQASNWYNGADVPDKSSWLSYCLVETKAPIGYNLDATAHYLTIDWNTGTATASPFTTELVNNEKTNDGNHLPLTGGDGVAALSVVGLTLVGGGIAYYLVASRKRREEDATLR